MSGRFSGRFSLKPLCLLLCFIIGFSFAINTIETKEVNAAPGWDYWKQNSGDDDSLTIGFTIWGLDSGDKVEVTFSIDRDYFDVSGGSGVNITSVE